MLKMGEKRVVLVGGVCEMVEWNGLVEGKRMGVKKNAEYSKN